MEVREGSYVKFFFFCVCVCVCVDDDGCER